MSSQPLPLNTPPAKVPYDARARDAEVLDLPVPDLPSPGRVECGHCHEWLPFDQFDELTDPMCAACRSKAAERELHAIRLRQCRKFSQTLVATGDGRAPLDHIDQFLAELMFNFGGMRVFVKEWSDQLRKAFDDRPGSKGNLDQCRSIAKLVMDCNKLQHQESVLDMSDEQLRAKKELALMQMLNDAAGDPNRRQILVELIRSGGIDFREVPGLVQGA
jgi:hypothetical protein